MERLDAAMRVGIAVAPNGGRRTAVDHPEVPVTAAALARTAAACLEAGASMMHVHVRDSAKRHLLDVDAYREATAAIRAAVGDRLVLQVTSEALGIYAPSQQMAVIRELRPEAVSLALRELAPDAAAEDAFLRFLAELQEARVRPQFILYSPGEAARLGELVARGRLPWRDVPVLYVLGRYTAGQVSLPADLLPFLAPGMPRFAHWMACAFGRHELACVTTAGLLGGHLRVGFENNLWLPDGRVAADNAELVRGAAALLSQAGCAVADADELRSAWDAMLLQSA